MRLRDLHKTMKGADRRKLASAVGISPGYLWQISTGWVNGDGRVKRPSLDLLAKLAAADARLHVHDMVAEFSEPKRAEEKASA